MIDSLILLPEITKGMKSIGSKGLLKIKEISILEYQINQILAINKNIRINIATGFEHEKILQLIQSKYKNNIRLIYNDTYDTTNQTKSIKLFLDSTECTDLLIINGGILLKNKCIDVASLQNTSKLYILSQLKDNFNIGCVIPDQTEYLFYDLPCPWSECVYLNSEGINCLKKIFTLKNTDQLFLFEVINDLITANIPFDNLVINKKNIFKINHLKDLKKAKNFI